MSVLELAMSKGNTTFPTRVTHPTTLSSIPITLDPRILAHPGIEPINELLYAGFLEHLGRCIYGGIVDSPKNPSPAELLVKQEKGRLGWRKDVIDVIGRKGELEVPMLRWPGGE
jgi:alpha-N-arabinofuranosidase